MLTELAVILDRSGSMASVASDITNGFDAFIKEQKDANLGEFKVSLTQFDSLGIETLYSGMAVADVPKLVLKPRGNTPLLDAVGKTIAALKERIENEIAPADGRRVMVVILTDGHENASREYTRAQIKAIIETQTAAGWNFVYLGANVDTFAEVSSLGISTRSASTYTPDSAGVGASFVALSSNTSNYRKTGAQGFSEQERGILGHAEPLAPVRTPRASTPVVEKINP